jgi:hypothetical protein
MVRSMPRRASSCRQATCSLYWIRHLPLGSARGRRGEALGAIEAALSISRETGINYLGAAYLGVLARTTNDPDVFERALAEGEALLASGAVSHNHFMFGRGRWSRIEPASAIRHR